MRLETTVCFRTQIRINHILSKVGQSTSSYGKHSRDDRSCQCVSLSRFGIENTISCVFICATFDWIIPWFESRHKEFFFSCTWFFLRTVFRNYFVNQFLENFDGILDEFLKRIAGHNQLENVFITNRILGGRKKRTSKRNCIDVWMSFDAHVDHNSNRSGLNVKKIF